jgi:two-component system LytT family response regulator
MKAVIIDDEQHCITTLTWSLNQYCKDVEVIGYAHNGVEGAQLIRQLNPNLVFLDIEMPILSGIDMLMKFNDIPFKVIFTTAYDKYAIKAIKLNALDFLLKPIDKDELIFAIAKAQKEILHITNEQIQLLNNIHKTKVADKIALSLSNGLHFINLSDIVRVEAEGNYCNFILADRRKILLSKKLGDAEEILSVNPNFYRAHKSHIINLKFVGRYIRGEGGEIIMSDGATISLSRSKKDEFLDLFNKI